MISDDLHVMLKVSGKPVAKREAVAQQSAVNDGTAEVRIEDGRLWYDKKW